MEIAKQIFLWAHSCEEDDHQNLVQYCCVSPTWRAVLFATPKLWYCIVRATRQPDTNRALAHISRAVNCPLHISFRISSDDNEIAPFLPILKIYCNRWRRIEIIGDQFPLIQQVLAFTGISDLHILEHLVVRNEPITSLPMRNSLLRRAPRLTTLAASSFLFAHFPPLKTLVNVTLCPCRVTRHILVALASSPVETLKFAMSSWASSFSTSPINFPSLLQLTVEKIEWGTLWQLLGVLVAPRLEYLDIALLLDPGIRAIGMEDSVNLSHHLRSVTHLSITALRIDAPMNYVTALIFLFGWKFPSVTHFTTNFPVDHLCALHTSAQTLHFPDDLEALGFDLGNTTSLPRSIPAVLFPLLVNLSCSDTTMHYSPHFLSWIAQFRSDMGYHLDSVTFHFDQLSTLNISLLRCFVGELHDWVGEEVDFQDGHTGY